MAHLCALLAEAQAAVDAQEHKPWLDGFDSNEEFAEFLGKVQIQLAADQLSWLSRQKLRLAFAPTSDWDDCVGVVDLGNEIYGLLLTLYGHLR